MSSTKFTIEKNTLLENLTNLLQKYDEFSKSVSPNHWRITGHHFTELRSMLYDISRFEEITPEERERVKDYL